MPCGPKEGMGLPHLPDRNTDIDPDTLPQVSQMWPIIPPTQSLKKGMNLAVEEAVMVASAIGPVLESAEAWRQCLQAPSSFAGSKTSLA